GLRAIDPIRIVQVAEAEEGAPMDDAADGLFAGISPNCPVRRRCREERRRGVVTLEYLDRIDAVEIEELAELARVLLSPGEELAAMTGRGEPRRERHAVEISRVATLVRLILVQFPIQRRRDDARARSPGIARAGLRRDPGRQGLELRVRRHMIDDLGLAAAL